MRSDLGYLICSRHSFFVETIHEHETWFFLFSFTRAQRVLSYSSIWAAWEKPGGFDEVWLLMEIDCLQRVSFFLKWSGSFRWHQEVLDGISGITKNIIVFFLKACERRNFDFCVFLRMCIVTKYLHIVFSRWNSYTTHPYEHTEIKVSPLTGLQMEKKYVFRNPRDAI